MDLFTRTLMMASGGGAPAGTTYWINSSTSVALRGIDVDASGNVYASGENGTGFYVVKFSGSGDVTWQRHLSAEITDISYGVSVASDGSVYVAGRRDNEPQAVIHSVLMKYNSSGTQQWARTLSSTGFNSQIKAIHWDSDSAIYVAGVTDNVTDLSNSLLLAKYDSTGALGFVRTLAVSNSQTEQASGVYSAAGGNVTMAGYGSPSTSDAVVAQYNSTGTIQWQRSLSGASSDSYNAVCVDTSSNVFVTGSTNSQGAGLNDLLLVKYNSTGTIQWQRSLGGTGSETGDAIAVDSTGNVYVVGTTASQGAGGNDILIAKYNTSGTIQWQRTLGTVAGGESGRGAAIGPNDTLYVLGNNTITKIPNDGTLTGTYGSYIYQTSTLTDAARTLTSATSTYTAATGSDTSASLTLSEATPNDTFSKLTL